LKYPSRRASCQAYPAACQRVRRRTCNSTPHIGSSPGKSYPVGSRRRPGRNHPISRVGSVLESLVLGLRENFVASGVRSGVLSFGRSGALRRAASSGRRPLASPQACPVGRLDHRFDGRFQRSFPESSQRPRYQSAGRILQRDCRDGAGIPRRLQRSVSLSDYSLSRAAAARCSPASSRQK